MSDYKVVLTTNGSPWQPKSTYAKGATFWAYNSVRVLSIQAQNAGTTGGGLNPDGSSWGNPFTEWLLNNAEMGSTWRDGIYNTTINTSILWQVTQIEPMVTPPLPVNPKPEQGVNTYNLNARIGDGGTPTTFVNFIPNECFNPLIWANWDRLSQIWSEQLNMTAPLYAVEIVFNAQIYVTGMSQPLLPNSAPFFSPFPSEEITDLICQIGEIADKMGIEVVTVQNAYYHQFIPNLTHIDTPDNMGPGGPGWNLTGSTSNIGAPTPGNPDDPFTQIPVGRNPFRNI